MKELNESTSDRDSDAIFHELSRLLASHGQQHLLQYWNELNAAEQQRLASQIREVDFAAIARLSDRKSADDNWSKLASQAEPPQAFRLQDSSDLVPFSPI